MEILPLIGDIFAGMMDPTSILLLIVGVVVDTVLGSIPGLSAAMAVAFLLSVIFAMQAHETFTLLMVPYIGGISGGLISAILISTPGIPSPITTCLDGSPMAKKGKADKALGTGVVSFFLGGLFPLLVLMFVAPSVAQITLKFSAIEYFGVCLFALSMIVALVGTSMIRGLLSGCLGLIIALVGMASIGGIRRFTFGINELSSGLDILPTLIGIFAIMEVLAYVEEVKKMEKATRIEQSFKIKGSGLTWKEFMGQKWNVLCPALIDTGIGILLGIGGSTAGILSRMTAKKTSKHPEKYSTGIMDGAMASETSNNAVIGGVLIPLLTLGIPGDGVTAMLLGAFMVHGLTLGPLLFAESAGLIYTIFIACVLANVAMLVPEPDGTRIFVRLLSILKYILSPMVLILCTVGTLATNNRIFDAQSIVILGVLDYLMSKFKLPMAPFVLSFIPCDLLGTNLRWDLMLTQNNFLAFFTYPIAAVFTMAAVLSVVWTVIKQVRNCGKETVGVA